MTLMKKLLLIALFSPVVAFAQSYPSPTFNSITLQSPLTAANGGTGTTTATGTGSVVLNTSPTFSGTPSGPTAAAGTSTTQFATTAFVGSAITGISTSVFGTLYASWFNSLPTTLPATSGVYWNNGGVLSKS
ncbi:hypothetical protein [Paraburkholderia acidisoli]|uniref:Uncharacterized protein n=1 Tax=Paraburkholderia acidisoli TaxID=2571748 RepID=A0A7Z2GRJ3_9BURK|nr:hypothetical protein [Paraburkholderia acidisoli]QGZ66259.1 hypothetical protein FAZ98_31140 [Paraburkholderia acidisoli]QGZ66347.1 hypothetical protein FAZ98_31635 [Paraburkholderia acidisoli]